MGKNIKKVRGKLYVTLREILFMGFISREIWLTAFTCRGGGKPSVRANDVRDWNAIVEKGKGDKWMGQS